MVPGDPEARPHLQKSNTASPHDEQSSTVNRHVIAQCNMPLSENFLWFSALLNSLVTRHSILSFTRYMRVLSKIKRKDMQRTCLQSQCKMYVQREREQKDCSNSLNIRVRVTTVSCGCAHGNEKCLCWPLTNIQFSPNKTNENATELLL